ncbi:MAG TPA: AMP-binding protein [Caulobacteraceae bacterium]
MALAPLALSTSLPADVRRRRQEIHRSVSTRDLEDAELARWRLRPGNPYGRIFAQLVVNEFAAPRTIAAFQDQRLRQLVAVAFERTPYYRDRIAALGLDRLTFGGQIDLPRLPILTKQEVIDNFDALHAQGLPEDQRAAVMTTSSGTTGRPVRVAMSRPADVMFGILAHRRRRWARLDPMGTVCAIKIASHFPRQHGALMPDGQVWRADRWQSLGAHFETGPAYGFNVWTPHEQQVAWLKQIRPDYLETYSTTMEELAYANDCATPSDTIKALFSSAISTAPSTRRLVERIYGAPLHDAYGLNEIGAVANQCEAGAYHVHVEHCLAEVVDADGAPCPPGQLGRLLVTGLQNLAMPLLRYDTGDVAMALEGPCACGRTLPALAAIGGRFRRFAYLPDGTRERHNALLGAIEVMPMELLKPLRQYQLYQCWDRGFDLRVRSVGGMSADFCERLQRVWAGIPGAADTPLRIVEVDEIKPSTSGKQLEFDSDFYPDPDADIDPRRYRAAFDQVAREGQG